MGSLANGRPYIREHSGVMTMPEYSEYSAVTFAVVANRVRLQVTGITEAQLKALLDLYVLADNGAETSEVRQVTGYEVVDGTPDTYFIIVSEPFTVAAASYDLLYVDPVNAQFVNTVVAGTEDVYVDGEAVVLAGETVSFEPAEPYRPLVLFSDYPYRLSNGFFFDLGGGGAGGGVESVSAENASIVVDNTDPANPIVGLPYLVYMALLTQTGTDAPVAIVLLNTLGGALTYSWNNTGSYSVLSAGNLFTVNKTLILLTGGSADHADEITMSYEIVGAGDIEFSSFKNGVISDDVLVLASIEIKVFP